MTTKKPSRYTLCTWLSRRPVILIDKHEEDSRVR